MLSESPILAHCHYHSNKISSPSCLGTSARRDTQSMTSYSRRHVCMYACKRCREFDVYAPSLGAWLTSTRVKQHQLFKDLHFCSREFSLLAHSCSREDNGDSLQYRIVLLYVDSQHYGRSQWNRKTILR